MLSKETVRELCNDTAFVKMFEVYDGYCREHREVRCAWSALRKYNWDVCVDMTAIEKVLETVNSRRSEVETAIENMYGMTWHNFDDVRKFLDM